MKWLNRKPPLELEDTGELRLLVARAIGEYMERLDEARNTNSPKSVFDLEPIWYIAERGDPRLAAVRFPKGSELASIWDTADTYCDATCEPGAYRGNEAQVEQYGMELKTWAAHIIEQHEG